MTEAQAKAKASLQTAWAMAAASQATIEAARKRCGTAKDARAGPMIEADAIGPGGTVRLRCYLPMADSVRLSVGCNDLASAFKPYATGSGLALPRFGPMPLAHAA